MSLYLQTWCSEEKCGYTFNSLVAFDIKYICCYFVIYNCICTGCCFVPVNISNSGIVMLLLLLAFSAFTLDVFIDCQE